jgi:hypothetical protein
LLSLPDGNPKYILLATDGQPNCTAAPGGSSNATQAAADAVTAVTNAAAAGIPTFVVGVATTRTTDTAVLNDLAVAGGEAQPSTNPLANKFYLANNQADLVTALQTITVQISTTQISCTFSLSSAPAAPDSVTVTVDGAIVPRDTTGVDGWNYTTSTDTSVGFYGSWCNTIMSHGTVVDIVFGC